MYKVVQVAALTSFFSLIVGFFSATMIKSYDDRVTGYITIHDCVMDKWMSYENETGIMPGLEEENMWRRQCVSNVSNTKM
jgi:hypothetical protein